MAATNPSEDINIDLGVTALVYNYLKTTPGVESLAKVYKKKFSPPTLPHNSPSLEQVFDHFQENAPVKRRLSLTPAKKVKKNSNDEAELPKKSENLKIPQKRETESNDAVGQPVQYLEVMNAMVYNYLKTIPATVPLAKQYKMEFNPPALSQNYPHLQQVFDYFQETAPVKRRLSMNLLTSTPPAKKAKDSNDDLVKADKPTIPTNAIMTIPQKKEMKKSDQEDDDFKNLVNSLVHNYLKATPSTVCLAEQFRTKFNPPELPKGFPTLEDVFGHFQMNAPINRRLVLNLSPPSSDNKSNDSVITNNKPAPVESINTLIKALIREKTTVKKKPGPSSAKPPKTSNLPHGTTPSTSVIKIKQEKEDSTKKPIHSQNNVMERKPQMHKPDSYNYSHSSTTSHPRNNTSISTKGKKITKPTDAYDAWTRWDNSVSNNNDRQCLQCKKIFPLRRSHLKVHLYTHMTPMEQKIVRSGWVDVCYYCNKRFISFSALAKHFAHHIGERPFKCDVVDCGKTFTQPHALKEHALSHSGNLAERLPFECNECGHRCTTKSRLREHDKSVHQGIRYNCRWCDATYASKSAKTAHEKKFHPEELRKESEKDE